MAALDFGRNRFAVTNNSSTSTKAHPRVHMGLYSPFGFSLTDARPPVFEVMQAANLTFRVVGTRAGRASRGKMNLGMFGSGRLYTSDYEYPSTWTPKILVIF